jgi:hypothetical protein
LVFQNPESARSSLTPLAPAPITRAISSSQKRTIPFADDGVLAAARAAAELQPGRRCKVAVRDFQRKRTITLTAGKS